MHYHYYYYSNSNFITGIFLQSTFGIVLHPPLSTRHSSISLQEYPFPEYPAGQLPQWKLPLRLMHSTVGFTEQTGCFPAHSSTSTMHAGFVPSDFQPYVVNYENYFPLRLKCNDKKIPDHTGRCNQAVLLSDRYKHHCRTAPASLMRCKRKFWKRSAHRTILCHMNSYGIRTKSSIYINE